MMLSVFLATNPDIHFGNPHLKAIIYKCIYYLIKISIVIVYTIYLNIIIKKNNQQKTNAKTKHNNKKKSTNNQSKAKQTLLAVETKSKTECRFYSSSSSSYTYIFHV